MRQSSSLGPSAFRWPACCSAGRQTSPSLRARGAGSARRAWARGTPCPRQLVMHALEAGPRTGTCRSPGGAVRAARRRLAPALQAPAATGRPPVGDVVAQLQLGRRPSPARAAQCAQSGSSSVPWFQPVRPPWPGGIAGRFVAVQADPQRYRAVADVLGRGAQQGQLGSPAAGPAGNPGQWRAAARRGWR